MSRPLAYARDNAALHGLARNKGRDVVAPLAEIFSARRLRVVFERAVYNLLRQAGVEVPARALSDHDKGIALRSIVLAVVFERRALLAVGRRDQDQRPARRRKRRLHGREDFRIRVCGGFVAIPKARFVAEHGEGRHAADAAKGSGAHLDADAIIERHAVRRAPHDHPAERRHMVEDARDIREHHAGLLGILREAKDERLFAGNDARRMVAQGCDKRRKNAHRAAFAAAPADYADEDFDKLAGLCVALGELLKNAALLLRQLLASCGLRGVWLRANGSLKLLHAQRKTPGRGLTVAIEGLGVGSFGPSASARR